MFISPIRCSAGAGPWLRIAHYTAWPAANLQLTYLEPNRRNSQSTHLTSNASAVTYSTPKGVSETMSDFRSVAQQLGKVPMTFESQQPGLYSQAQPLPQRDVPSRMPTVPTASKACSFNVIEDSQILEQLLGTIEPANMIATKQVPKPATAPTVAKQAATRPSKQPTATFKNPSLKQKAGRETDREAKVDPSPASGGIPNVTNEYLRACLSTPSLLREPQHLLVVIDLNGTLLYRPSRKNPTRFQMRPHARDFLRYCVNTFKVVIWSSAKPQNVTAMCDTILTHHIKEKVVAIWGRDKFDLTKEDFNLRVQCYKRLSRIWQDPTIANSQPLYHQGVRWDQTNTVLIDDSREKARTEPHNLVEVPEWSGDLNEKDDILPQVHDYLNHLSMHSNVSACLKRDEWKPIVF